MKYVLTPVLIMLASFNTYASEKYSDMVYTATSFMYWCEHQEIPRSVSDFAKVTDVNDPNPNITTTPETWFKTVKFQIEGDVLYIYKGLQPNGNYQSKATSNCASFKYK